MAQEAGATVSKKGSFIGGHSVLTQRPRDFDAELERKAERARKRAIKEQAAFDKTRAKKLAETRAKIEALNMAMNKAAADRRAVTKKQRPDKPLRATKDFVVLKISRTGSRNAK
jgi:hypothetical protein